MDKLIKYNFVEYDEVFVIGKNQKTSPNPTLDIDEQDIENQEDDIVKTTLEEAEEIKLNAKIEAKEILKNARELADEMLSTTNEESKKIIERAKWESEEIFSEKEKEGFESGERKYDNLLKEAKKILEEAEEYKRNIFLNQEKEIIELVIQCVNKIIRHKLNESDELVTNLIISSIEDLNSREKLIVKISREDFDSTSKLRSKILSMFPGIKDIEIKIIDNYQKGDIEIESVDGTVNPSIKNQIIKLRDEFSKLLEGE